LLPDSLLKKRIRILSSKEFIMLRKLMFVFIGILGFYILTSCALNLSDISHQLNHPTFLDEKTGTKRINLAENGQCSTVTLPVNPVNIETRTEKYVVSDTGNPKQYLIPKEFIENAVQYLERKLIESNLKVEEQSGKKILVSLEEAKSNSGVWSHETNVKLKIVLPEINYIQIYSGIEGGHYPNHAIAYALHLAIHEFFNDPVFQDYVKCQ